MMTFAAMITFSLFASGAAAGGSVRGGRTVDAQMVEKSLRDTMEAVLRGGDGAVNKQLERIEASIWQTYEALPKNDVGRLAPKGVRYLVHHYFAKEHGWLIQGLEPHGNQAEVSEVHEVNILQDKAPALVESLLEHQRGDRGLSITDVVSMVAALERLIFDESLTLLNASYGLNDVATSQPLTETQLHEILSSYLLLFELGHKANLTDSRTHHMMKQRAAKAGGNWPTLVKFEQDAVSDYTQANTLATQSYTYQETSQIMENLASGYGKWQNSECVNMKQALMGLSDGSGRVPTSKFYSQSATADYHFSESMEYLRHVGALDESNPKNPRVRIANYMAGPSNCIASSSYYSVCCISECEGLMNQLETRVHASTAAPERLLSLVKDMSSSSVAAGRQLPAAMADRLHVIAERHGGEVPLHGRLFAQWLHHAFPNECPYPEIAQDASVLTPSHWLDKKVAAADRKELAQAMASKAESDDELAWTDEELLHVHPSRSARARSTLGSLVRVAMQLAMLFGLFRVALSSWRSASSSHMGLSNLEKAKKFDLPF
jgi:hypothetical protein